VLGYAGDGASTDMSVSGGVVAVANGGTGRSTLTPGALLYASGTNSTGMLGPATAGKVVISAGAAPSYSAYTLPASFPKGSMPYASAAEQVSALLSPASASVLTHPGGTGVPAWSATSGFALIAASNTFTGATQAIAPAAAAPVLQMVSPGVVAGSSYSGSIQFLDGVALGGSFNASFANSAGNRALEFSGGSDRDGNRVPIRLSTRNAAGTSTPGIDIGAGANAGSISIGSNGATGTVLVRMVGTIQGGAANQNGAFVDVTFPSDATGFGRGVYSRVHTAAAAFTMADAPCFYAANPIVV
jgi:hypothetical protein